MAERDEEGGRKEMVRKGEKKSEVGLAGEEGKRKLRGKKREENRVRKEVG